MLPNSIVLTVCHSTHYSHSLFPLSTHFSQQFLMNKKRTHRAYWDADPARTKGYLKNMTKQSKSSNKTSVQNACHRKKNDIIMRSCSLAPG